MLFEGSMVGNVKVCELDVVEELKFEEEENCLFAKFPIDATIQDGGKRKEVMKRIWFKHSKNINITKHSKS